MLGDSVYVCVLSLGPNITSTTTCDIDGNLGTVLNNSCYAIIPSELSWFEARYKCQMLGGDLAVFDETSPSDREAIHSLLPNATLFWIGLRKNPWIWVTAFDSGLNGHDQVLKYQNVASEDIGDQSRHTIAVVIVTV